MREIHRHVDTETLEQYSMGTSSVEMTTVIEEHLLTCGECQRRLRETEDYLLAMRTASEQLRRDARGAKGREWRIPAWFTVLAAAGVMLLVAATLRLVRPAGPVVGVTLTALRGNGAVPLRWKVSARPVGGPRRPTHKDERADGVWSATEPDR